MIIKCPSCSTKFRAADDYVTMGKSVECSVCSHSWIVSPVNTQSVDDFTSFENVNAKLKALNERKSYKKYLVIALVLIIATGFAAYVNRGTVKKMAPDLYNLAFGTYKEVKKQVAKPQLNTPLDYVSVNTKSARMVMNAGKPVLRVSGYVLNNGTESVRNIRLNVYMRDKNGKLLKKTEYALPLLIQNKSSKPFSIMIPNPPRLLVNVVVNIVK